MNNNLTTRGLPYTFLVLGSFLFLNSASASDEDDLAEMQRQLNSEVMSQPFLAEQPEKVDAYIQDAMKKKLVPPEYKGSNWQPGYSCRDLLRYSWREYRNCRYYHHYYGYYYR